MILESVEAILQRRQSIFLSEGPGGRGTSGTLLLVCGNGGLEWSPLKV